MDNYEYTNMPEMPEMPKYEKKRSPFAESDYVTPFDTGEAEIPVYKKKTSHVGRKILAVVLVLILLVGTGVGTALIVGNHWQNQINLMEESFQQRLDVLQEEITHSNGGSSVSGAPVTGSAMTPSEVFEKTHFSVVSIVTEGVEDVNGVPTEYVGSGSGFLISPDGYIVSNQHVIEGASSVTVNTCFGKVYPAEVVGYDVANDISLLKIDGENLPYVNIGKSSDMTIGEQVVAIGYPLGAESPILTVGYVSTKDKVITTEGNTYNAIQTDAAINSGSSGGPLFNMQGEVVGITTAKTSGSSSTGVTIESVNFAIPMDDVVGMLGDLQEFGYVTGAYLGIWVRDVDDYAQSYGLPAGAFVDDVMEGMAAQKGGIQSGDIIINLGGHDVSSMTELTLVLRKFKAGDSVVVTVYRNGKVLYLTVVLEEKPREEETPATEDVQQEPEESASNPFEEWYYFLEPFFGEWDN